MALPEAVGRNTCWWKRICTTLNVWIIWNHEHNKDNLGSNNYAPIFCCQISSRFCRILRLLLLLFIPRADQELALSQQKVETWLPYFSRSWRACCTDFNKPTESSSSSWWLFSRCLSIRKCSGNHEVGERWFQKIVLFPTFANQKHSYWINIMADWGDIPVWHFQYISGLCIPYLGGVQAKDKVNGRKPAPVEIGSLSHYLQGFIHPKRWLFQKMIYLCQRQNGSSTTMLRLSELSRLILSGWRYLLSRSLFITSGWAVGATNRACRVGPVWWKFTSIFLHVWCWCFFSTKAFNMDLSVDHNLFENRSWKRTSI